MADSATTMVNVAITGIAMSRYGEGRISMTVPFQSVAMIIR